METPWWQTTTIYQIYPRSFMDSNGDGIGDLPGIISRLDHVAEMGFETIWLSPFYASPQQDFGYDISDYYGIAPEYGTMEDAERLIQEVHRRGMRVVFDMIFGHTSIEHPWFRESRSSRDNPKADWYIWRAGRGSDRRPPTNWKSITGVNGWQYEERRDEWFYTNFLHFQPDLNFRNPRVKEAMFDAVRFWLEKGVDGFRLDIFHAIYKDDQFRDNPFSFRVGQPVDSNDGANQVKKYTMNLPENVELARELREVTDRWSPERVLIGEVFGEHPVIRRYLGEVDGSGGSGGSGNAGSPGLHTIFLFEMLRFSFRAQFFRRILRKFEELYPEPLVPTLVLGNHDRPRWISRLGGGRGPAGRGGADTSGGGPAGPAGGVETSGGVPAGARETRATLARTDDKTQRNARRSNAQRSKAQRKARCIALLQLTVRGIPVIYYGEEIGMEDGDFPFTGALDPVARQFAWLPRWVARLLGLYLNRDGCRTPMQWDGSPGAGFSGGAAGAEGDAVPWLPLLPEWQSVNVAGQKRDPDSLLNLYRDLLALRARLAPLREGSFTLLEGREIPRSVLCYRRTVSSGESVLVAINFGRRRVRFALPRAATPHTAAWSLLFRTHQGCTLEEGAIVLPAASGVVVG